MFTPSGDDNDRLPRGLVAIVLLACVLPILLRRATGVHFIPAGADGSLVHSLLEWSAVCASFFTAFLAFLYLRVRADYLVLTIALAASVAGLWDALHAVASLGLIPISTELQRFVPFTWAVSRTMTALVLMMGASYILFRAPRSAPLGFGWLLAGGGVVVVVTWAFLELAVRESIPLAQFPDALVKRPWDVPPLILFAINGFILFPLLVRAHPSILSRTLALSAIPAIVSGALMSFSSTSLYDHPFQLAHALKLVAVVVPFIGISLYFIRAFRRERNVADRLERAVSEHKLAEEALKKSEGRHRALLEAMPDLMFTIDKNGTILDYNAHATIPLYRPPSEFLGKNVTELFPDFAERVLEAVKNTLDAGTIQSVEYRLAMGDYEGDYEARFVRSAEDEVLAVVRDITEHKRLEKEVLDISHREQLRIGHDLHDGISQQLTGIALLCKALQRKLSANNVAEASEARQIEELVDDAIAQTRSLARGLAPVQLEEGGLSAALEELAHGVESRHAVRCRFRWDEEFPVPSHAVATHLYRIAQEAVQNALKHGDPSTIAIHVVRDNGRMRLSVQDDGSGLDSDVPGNGMGLHIMRYRARMIDATLEIHPAPDKGTVVTCEWSS